MAIHVHPIDLPSPYYRPIGQIAAGSNLTEVLMASIIWHFHGITDPRVGRLFTYHANFVRKLRILEETIDMCVRDETLKTKLLALHDEADAFRIERNAFVHGLWGHMPNEPNTWKRFDMQKIDKTTFLMNRTVVPLKHLKAIAARVRKLNLDFETLMRENGIPPP